MRQILFVACLTLISFTGHAQDLGQIHGNFQIDGQYYREDSSISAVVPEEIGSLSGFGNIIYRKGDFSAGLRYEAYLPAPVGYPAGASWEGAGIGYRFARYDTDLLDITVGNFYEQFGNGLILRAWEDRGLGVDYALDGVRINSNPLKGVYLKALYGKQRLRFDDELINGPGTVRGADAEIYLNQAFDSLFAGSKSTIIIGGSVVSKYQQNNNSQIDNPENVSAYSIRGTYINGGFRFNGEWAEIGQNPSFTNSQITNIPDTLNPGVGLFKGGRGLQIQTGYSTRGFGITAEASSLANMSYQSDRSAGPFDSWINYLPPATVLQTYLLSQFYPYAVQPNGEIAYRGEVFYTIPKGSQLGGKYGTKINIGYTHIQPPDTTQLNDLATTRRGVDFSMFEMRDEVYYQELNVQLERRFSSKFKAKLMYQNLVYDNDVLLGAYDYQDRPASGKVFAQIGVFEGLIRLKDRKSLRFEAQAMFTDQHLQDWAALVLEYSIAPHWFFSVLDQWNYGNDDPDERYHFPVVSAGYIKDSHRITVNYGRQRAGVFCVGGVCRVVPASNGFSVSITSSF